MVPNAGCVSKADSNTHSVLQVDYTIIASQAGTTLNNLMSHAQDLVAKLRSLQFDQRDFVCLKFLVLFSLGKKSFSDTTQPSVTK